MTDLAVPIEPAAPPAMSAIQRLIGIFVSPVKAFQDIARRPSWLVPLAIMILVAVGTNAILLPKVDWESAFADRMEKMKTERGITMTEEQIQKQGALTRRFSIVGGLVGTFLILPIISLLIALIYFGIIRMGKGGISYAGSFAVVCWSSLPVALKFLITGVAALARSEITQKEMQALVPSNPAFFLNPEQVGTFAYSALQYIDAFSIWAIVLTVLGLAAASTWNRGKCATLVIGLNVVAMVLFSALAAVATRFTT